MSSPVTTIPGPGPGPNPSPSSSASSTSTSASSSGGSSSPPGPTSSSSSSSSATATTTTTASTSTRSATSTTTTATRLPVPVGVESNSNLRACHQYPLASITSLRSQWSTNLLSVLSSTQAQTDDAVEADLAAAFAENPAAALDSVQADFATLVLPVWGSRTMAGCVRFPEFHPTRYFCSDGTVLTRSCPVSDKCPPRGQTLMAQGAPAVNVSSSDAAGAAAIDNLFLPLAVVGTATLTPTPAASTVISGVEGVAAITVSPPRASSTPVPAKAAQRAVFFGCWDWQAATTPPSRQYLCQVPQPAIAAPGAPETVLAPALPQLACPVPFLSTRTAGAQATVDSAAPGVVGPGSSNNSAPGASQSAGLPTGAIVAIALSSVVALVGAAVFVLWRRRHFSRSRRGKIPGVSATTMAVFPRRFPESPMADVRYGHHTPGMPRAAAFTGRLHDPIQLNVFSAPPTEPMLSGASVVSPEHSTTGVYAARPVWENTVVLGGDALQLPLLGAGAHAVNAEDDVATRVYALWDAFYARVHDLVVERYAAVPAAERAKVHMYQTVAGQAMGSLSSLPRALPRTDSAATAASLLAPPAAAAAAAAMANTRVASLSSPVSSPRLGPAPASLDVNVTPGGNLDAADIAATEFQLANVFFAFFLRTRLLAANRISEYTRLVYSHHPRYRRFSNGGDASGNGGGKASKFKHGKSSAAASSSAIPPALELPELYTALSELFSDPATRATAFRHLAPAVNQVVRDFGRVFQTAGLASTSSSSTHALGRSGSLRTATAIGFQSGTTPGSAADDVRARDVIERGVELVFRIKALDPALLLYFPPARAAPDADRMQWPAECAFPEEDGGEPERLDSPAPSLAESPRPLLAAVDGLMSSSPAASMDGAPGDEEEEGPRVQFAHWPGVWDAVAARPVVKARVWLS
ncbi:hypothetical protein H9P43_009958 [Blastocladiella emersonii ATCC 22665]|nr:hypothetical protein H9P43_009958 [Blastocladiella emersonii ATCC 22665]